MKMLRTTAFLVAASTAIAGFAADARAGILTFNDRFTGSASKGGVSLAYNTQTQQLDVTIDAFMSNQNAIGLTFGSGRAGGDNAVLWIDTVNERVTAFEHRHWPRQWLIDRTFDASVGDFITGYSSRDSNFSYDAGNQQTMFSIDISAINNHSGGAAWEGLDFGNTISGSAALFWYATTGLSPFRYNPDGSIRRAIKDDGATFGTFAGKTTNTGSEGSGQVPGPSPISLVVAMTLLCAWRRRRSLAG